MIDLPKPVAAYFAADPQADKTVLAQIFDGEAIVRDENKEHRGIAPIHAWRLDVMARTPFTARPLSFHQDNDTVTVPAEVTGAFPGSPITLEHRFTLRDGRITLLEIK